MKSAFALLAVLVLVGCQGAAPSEPVANAAPTTTPAPTPPANEATMANVPGSATNAATNGGMAMPSKAEMEKQLAEIEKTYDAEIAKATDPQMKAQLETAKANALKAMRTAMEGSGAK